MMSKEQMIAGMPKDAELELPATFTINVRIRSKSSAGNIEIELPTGKHPTRQAIAKALEEAQKTAEEHGYHICNCSEFMEALALEKGYKIKIAGNPQFIIS
jgi:hypothetical protein